MLSMRASWDVVGKLVFLPDIAFGCTASNRTESIALHRKRCSPTKCSRMGSSGPYISIEYHHRITASVVATDAFHLQIPRHPYQLPSRDLAPTPKGDCPCRSPVRSSMPLPVELQDPNTQLAKPHHYNATRTRRHWPGSTRAATTKIHRASPPRRQRNYEEKPRRRRRPCGLQQVTSFGGGTNGKAGRQRGCEDLCVL
jgi:hypothetical protein